MKQEKLSIRFVISTTKTNKEGLCPISCRLTYKKQRKPFSTGLFVNPKDWNSKKQLVAESSKSQNMDAQMELSTNKINNAYLSLLLEGEESTVDDIFNKYIGKPTNKEFGVINYFKEFLDKRKKLVGIDIQLGTWKKFNYAYQQVKDFIKWKYRKHDHPLSQLKLQSLHDFEYYLKTERKQSQVTINKAIQRFRKPIKTAVAEGFLEKDPFVLHKPGWVRKAVIFLSNEELDKLG